MNVSNVIIPLRSCSVTILYIYCRLPFEIDTILLFVSHNETKTAIFYNLMGHSGIRKYREVYMKIKGYEITAT